MLFSLRCSLVYIVVTDEWVVTIVAEPCYQWNGASSIRWNSHSWTRWSLSSPVYEYIAPLAQAILSIAASQTIHQSTLLIYMPFGRISNEKNICTTELLHLRSIWLSMERTKPSKNDRLSNVFQHLEKSNESKGITKAKNLLFNYLSIVAHGDRHEMMFTLIASFLPIKIC